MGSPVTLLDHGFFRARAVSPVLSLAQPRDNARALTAAARAAEEAEVALLLTPELSLTGYSGSVRNRSSQLYPVRPFSSLRSSASRGTAVKICS